MILKTMFAVSCLLTAIITATVALKTKPTETTRWAVMESSNLQVNGSTNVNQFTCVIPACTEIDTLTVSRSKTEKQVALSGRIDLDIESFDCHNGTMTNDLRKTLKEKQFPKLYVRFLSLNELPELSSHPVPVTGEIEIEIAGVRKRFEVNYHISIDDKKVIELLGDRDVNFSDFNLTPPKRLAGLVRAKDKLTVVFHLNMKEI